MVGSLGIALAPALAEAASSASSTHVTASAATSASAFTKKVAQQDKVTFFTKNLVRHHTAAVAGPNPTLGLTGVGFATTAYGISLVLSPSNLTTGNATITINWGDSSPATTQIVNSASQDVVVDHEYSQLGTYALSMTIDDGAGDTATLPGSAETLGSEYTAYSPTRILDTRKAIGAPAAPVAAGKTLSLQVTGAGTSGDTIPDGITAVVLNVTAVSPTANGVLTVYGDEDAYGDPETLPTTSNVNYKAGQNVPNLVIVPVGLNGKVDFHNGGSKGNTQILADVAGYFTAGQNTDKYVGISPARILDTRHGTGTGKVAKIPANGSVTLTVAGSDNGTIPATGVDAISMNLTAVSGTKNGVITAYPDGESSVPTVSNINYSAGQTIANMSIVKVGADGKVVLHNNSNGTVDLIADANGYFSSTTTVANASAYVPFDSPQRYVDTRVTDNTSPIEGAVPTGTPIGIPIAGYSYETAEVFNATVVSPTGNGFLSLYPYNPSSPSTVPSTSNLNYLTGQTVPNLAITELGTTPDKQFDNGYDFGLYLGGKGTSQVIVDWFGEFQDQ